MGLLSTCVLCNILYPCSMHPAASCTRQLYTASAAAPSQGFVLQHVAGTATMQDVSGPCFLLYHSSSAG